MDVSFVRSDGITDHDAGEVEALLAKDDGFVWVDVPEWDEQAEHLLRDVLHCHPLVLDACRTRNHVPTVHRYEEHLFVVLVLGGYVLGWAWTGFRGNTLWDWLELLVVPFVLPVVLLQLSREEERLTDPRSTSR